MEMLADGINDGIMYDMVRLAAGVGWCPEDFDRKGNSGGFKDEEVST